MQLEKLTPGTTVRGIVPDRIVTVVQAEWHGTNAITLTYRDDRGQTNAELLYRDDESRLFVEEGGRPWAFDADGYLFRLASEARRIELAYLFDPFLAVQTSSLEPLPHQISAVYEHMLPRQPLRFLLADDPGAGKTIMAGLYIKELLVRGDLSRCLIVAPGSLVEQWQDELYMKFGLSFQIMTRDMIEASRTGNPFSEKSLLIARLDQLSRYEEVQNRLGATDWDLVVVDEAHKMSAHYYGNELKETKRYKLGRLLGGISRHLLLMTATPHAGKDEDFYAFLALLDADRFEGRVRDSGRPDTRDLMRRMVKERLLRFDGRPLFPERRAYSVGFELSDPEIALYHAVTKYVREEMNRADRVKEAGEPRRGAAVGFALTTLQRRLASSPEAIFQSLKRRKGRLEKRLLEERADRRGAEAAKRLGFINQEFDFEEDDVEDLTDAEREELEEELVDEATAARTMAELEQEIESLAHLERLAAQVRSLGTDRKWLQLAEVMDDRLMYHPDGSRRKLIVFTEHKDTLNYLVERLQRLLGRSEAVVYIHGGVRREERRKVQEAFTQDKDVLVLVATDAAGEGINLQRANLMVNYDLPWNPNRIEQRFGRIHRIGQVEICHLWNLVAKDTREGEVFLRLLEKMEEQRDALGDQVFDVLGNELFENTSLREMLIEAIRYGDQPEVRRRLEEVVDAAVGGHLRRLINERALVSDVLTGGEVERIREQMELAEARRLQPHNIREFFMAAFDHLSGRLREREPGRYEILHVSADVRQRDRAVGSGIPVLRHYERVTFHKELVNLPGKPLAELLSPGHPLLESVSDIVLERYGPLLKKGAVLVDPDDTSEEPRVLLYLEHAIQDARPDATRGGRRVVSRRFQFVEVSSSGRLSLAGYAPFLDYRPLNVEESGAVNELLRADWLRENLEQSALNYAVSRAVPDHLEEVRRRTLDRVDRTSAAVKDRLTREIQYWDRRANELREQELAGRQPRMNPDRARQRADDLEARLKKRLEELDQERQLSPQPPVIVGGALVVPAGYLARLSVTDKGIPPTYTDDRDAIDKAAVAAVLETEVELGRDPEEMSHNNPGFDILSKDPDTGDLYFLEVKGRVVGALTVCVKKNQILTALNKPERFILALVEVGDSETRVRYVRRPFEGTEETFFNVASVNYDWEKLWESGAEPKRNAPL